MPYFYKETKMATKTVRKVTFALDAALIEQVQHMVKEGKVKSQTEFIEQAMRARLRQIEWEEWCKEMEEASKDPLFLADQEEIDREFAYADAESARMIE
jgi:Arc/MetJ-type ribon-helix-helix transcriptional regulator